MSSPTNNAPTKEVALIAAGYRGRQEDRKRWIVDAVQYMRRLGRRTRAGKRTPLFEASINFLYRDAEQKSASLNPSGSSNREANDQIVSSVANTVSVLVEVELTAVMFKDCADLLWRTAERNLTWPAIAAIQSPFSRCVKFGPPDAFTAVTTRIISAFRSDSAFSVLKKILAIVMLFSITKHQSNLFVSHIETFFDGVWMVVRELETSDERELLKRTFSAAIDVLRLLADSYQSVVAKLFTQFRVFLHSKREQEVSIAFLFFEPLMRIASTAGSGECPSTIELFAVLWKLKDKEATRWQALNALLVVAQHDPTVFTTDLYRLLNVIILNASNNNNNSNNNQTTTMNSITHVHITLLQEILGIKSNSKKDGWLQNVQTQLQTPLQQGQTVDFRRLLLDYTDERWRKDSTKGGDQMTATTKEMIPFFEKMLLIPFHGEGAWTDASVEAYFIAPIRARLALNQQDQLSFSNISDASTIANFVNNNLTRPSGSSNSGVGAAGQLHGCWEILTLLRIISNMFPYNTQMLDAQVAPCVMRMLSWGSLDSLVSKELPLIVAHFSEQKKIEVLETLLDLVSTMLCGQSFRNVTNSNTSETMILNDHYHKQSTLTTNNNNTSMNFTAGSNDSGSNSNSTNHSPHSSPLPQHSSGGNANSSGYTATTTDIVTALKTISVFSLSQMQRLGDFVQLALFPLLDHPSAPVRVEAIHAMVSFTIPDAKQGGSVLRGVPGVGGSGAHPYLGNSITPSRSLPGNLSGAANPSIPRRRSQLNQFNLEFSYGSMNDVTAVGGSSPGDAGVRRRESGLSPLKMGSSLSGNDSSTGAVPGWENEGEIISSLEQQATQMHNIQSVLRALLHATNYDVDASVREIALTSISNKLTSYITDSSNLGFIFAACTDAEPGVRLAAFHLLCQLEDEHQVLVRPALRRHLVTFLTDLRDVADANVVGEILPQLQTILVEVPALAAIYAQNVISTVLPILGAKTSSSASGSKEDATKNNSLADLMLDDEEEKSRKLAMATPAIYRGCLRCLSAIIRAQEFKISEQDYRAAFERTLVLADNAASTLRCEALDTAVRLIQQEEVFSSLPDRDKYIQASVSRARAAFLDADTPQEVKVSGLRVLGAIGAIDPDLYRNLLQANASGNSGVTIGGEERHDVMTSLSPNDPRECCLFVLQHIASSLSAITRTEDGTVETGVLETFVRSHLRTIIEVLETCRDADGSLQVIVPALIDIVKVIPCEGTTESIFFVAFYLLIRAVHIKNIHSWFADMGASPETTHSRHDTTLHFFPRMFDVDVDDWQAWFAVLADPHNPVFQNEHAREKLPLDLIYGCIVHLWNHNKENARVHLFVLKLSSLLMLNPMTRSAFSVHFNKLIPMVLQDAEMSQDLFDSVIDLLLNCGAHLSPFMLQVIRMLLKCLNRPNVTELTVRTAVCFLLLTNQKFSLQEYAGSVIRCLSPFLQRFAESKELCRLIRTMFNSIDQTKSATDTPAAAVAASTSADFSAANNASVGSGTGKKKTGSMIHNQVNSQPSSPLQTSLMNVGSEVIIDPKFICEFRFLVSKRNLNCIKKCMTWGYSSGAFFLPEDFLTHILQQSNGVHSQNAQELPKSLTTAALAEEVKDTQHTKDPYILRTLAVATGTSTRWIQHLMALIVQCSPLPIFRCIHDPLSEHSHGLVKSIFLVAFRVYWSRSTAMFRRLVSDRISQLLDGGMNQDVALLILSMAETLDIVGEPFSIERQRLASVALRFGATAKALRWLEDVFILAAEDAKHEFNSEALVRIAKQLIPVYGNIDSPISAYGLLNVLPIRAEEKSVLTEESLINMKRYQEALAVTQRILRQKQRNEQSADPTGVLGGFLDRHTSGRPSHHRIPSMSVMEMNSHNPSFADDTTLLEQESRMRCNFMLGRLPEVLEYPLPQSDDATFDDDTTANNIVQLASSAALSLQQWNVVDKTLDSPFFTRECPQYAITAAAQAIHRRSFKHAREWINTGLTQLAKESSFSTLHLRERTGYEHLVLAQQFLELEEITDAVSVAPDADKMIDRLRSTWNKRSLRTQPSESLHWRQLLTTRQLLIPPPKDVETRLLFADRCRYVGQQELERVALLEVIGHAPTQEELETGHVDPRVAVAYAEHLCRGAERLPRLTAPLGHPEPLSRAPSNPHWLDAMITAYEKNEQNNASVARLCLLRARMEKDSSSKLVANLAAKAKSLDPTNFTAWREWANVQTRSYETKHESTAFRGAIYGFVQSIIHAPTPAHGVQDALITLVLWSGVQQHAIPLQQKLLDILQQELQHVPTSCLLLVVPQLVAKIGLGSELSSQIACRELLRLFDDYPDHVLFPILFLATSAEAKRMQDSKRLLEQMREKNPELIEQGLMVSRELCRVAKEPWLSGIFGMWELYTKYCDGSKHLKPQLIEELLNFFGPDGVGPSEGNEKKCPAELSFLVNNHTALSQARALTERYLLSGHDADLHATFTVLEGMYRNPINRCSGKSLRLHQWSPKLWAARDLLVPVPQLHAKLSSHKHHPGSEGEAIRMMSFHDEVGIISSKQAPRRISIMGSNGARCRFLLKGGEDLRLDERVMQLFGLVNNLLAETHNENVLQRLRVQRYSVTPLSGNVGLCGWVEECDTLNELIMNYRNMAGIPPSTRLEFLLRGHLLPGEPDAPLFNYEVPRLPIMGQVEVFEYVCEATSGDDLRRAFWATANNAENWLRKRTLYMQSLAAMSMVGHILGLGDRHVTNIMVQRNTGQVVHIDFGDCFEVALTRPVQPEHVPFRLTRMLVRAMDVAGIEGPFRNTAEHVMGVMRDKRVSVIAMLEAFIDDPLVSWRLTADQQAPKDAEHGAAAQEAGTQLEHGADPERKKSEELKSEWLDGMDTPADTMMGGMGDSGYDAASPQHMQEAKASLEPQTTQLFGPSPNSSQEMTGESEKVIKRIKAKLRGRETGPKATVKQQVATLIDEATDPINLARAWVGWHPWW